MFCSEMDKVFLFLILLVASARSSSARKSSVRSSPVCGQVSDSVNCRAPVVFGGKPSCSEESPWYAIIHKKDRMLPSDKIIVHCGGTIIGPRYIVTRLTVFGQIRSTPFLIVLNTWEIWQRRSVLRDHVTWNIVLGDAMNWKIMLYWEGRFGQIREGAINILRKGVCQIGGLRPPDAYPPHF